MNPVLPRKLKIVKAVCDNYTLTRPLIQEIAGMKNDRVVRAILQELCAAGLINRARMQAVHPTAGNPAPVYFPTRQGAELVAAHFDDERYLHVCCRTPDWTHLFHWVAVAEFHIRLNQAISRQSSVSLLGWYGEWDEVNPQAHEPDKRFRIYSKIREKPRLVCAPDAAFALAVGRHSKIYYLEMDRGTSGIQQIANSKTPGYAGLLAAGLHRRHFETTAETFTVLHLSSSPARRDLLRKAIATKERAELHRFAAFSDWTPEKALFAPIFHGCDSDEPQALISLAPGDAQ